jgi:hypothetical protein
VWLESKGWDGTGRDGSLEFWRKEREVKTDVDADADGDGDVELIGKLVAFFSIHSISLGFLHGQ